MQKNDLWMLDAHCDSFEMRNFLDHNFDLRKGKYLISQKTMKFLVNTFQGTAFSATARNIEHNYHVTLSHLNKGNIKALFVNVADYDLLQSSRIINAVYELSQRQANKLAICFSRRDVHLARKAGLTALILVAEGPLVFHGQVDLLKNWHRLGIRIVNLSHGEGTQGFPEGAKLIYKDLIKFAPQCALQISTSTERYLPSTAREKLYKKEKGLSQVGREMLEAMVELNIICDLSHANDAAFWEALETYNGKFCATHSNCAALCNHTRNLTDKMMQALAQQGGVMGLCFYGKFIDERRPSLNRFVEHVLHALTIMGPDHVGVGSDFDGVEPGAFMAISHPGKIDLLWEKLDKSGVDKETLEKIAHNNFLRLLGGS